MFTKSARRQKTKESITKRQHAANMILSRTCFDNRRLYTSYTVSNAFNYVDKDRFDAILETRTYFDARNVAGSQEIVEKHEKSLKTSKSDKLWHWNVWDETDTSNIAPY